MSEREFGRCKNWNSDRGYGFIRRNDGSDLFVHTSETGFLPLQAGDKVAFDVGENPRTNKPEAKRVSVVTSP